MIVDPYVALLGGLGLLVLLVAWVPLVTRELPLSLPLVCIALGAVVFALPEGGSALHPADWLAPTERMTELVVLIALTGCGLRIDERPGVRRWASTWWLLGVTMPLSIAAGYAIGTLLLGLPPATAMLLGAVLAPTDPVLAADVQVGPPRSGPGGGVRFALTSEAGLNDGLAFPFTWLAIGLALNGSTGGPWTWDWLLVDVVWRLAAGAGIGYGVGRLLGWLVFGRDDRAVLSATRDGFVAVGVTFISYAAAELAHGYGFIAVFVAAVVLRRAERDHEGDYVVHLHHFIEQIERLLMMVLLVLFGGSVVGGLLDALTWTGAAAALLLVFLVRPLAGMVALVPTRQYRREAMVTAFFGIRGVGSFYYLAFAAGHAEFPELAAVWSVVGFTVLVSVVVHGIASTPVMRWLDRTLYEPEADRRRAVRQRE